MKVKHLSKIYGLIYLAVCLCCILCNEAKVEACNRRGKVCVNVWVCRRGGTAMGVSGLCLWTWKVAAMGVFGNVLMAEGGVRTSEYTHTV